MRLQRQTLTLGVIGVVDLATTLYFINQQGAAEANPLMAGFLSQGLTAFMAAKVGFLAGPLAMLEWARRFNPVFVTRALNVGVAAYIGLYSVGVARLNAEPDWEHMGSPRDAKVWAPIEAKLKAKRARMAASHRVRRIPDYTPGPVILQAVY